MERISREKLSKYRSEVIEKFINTEWLINSIISQHFLGKIKENFLLQVLNDEYFNFALRRNILEKIVPEFDKKKMQDLRELNKIRNYFAHCNQEILRPNEKLDPILKGRVLNPKKPEEELNFQKLYEQFNNKIKEMNEYLTKVLTGKGSKLHAEK